jgi:hypothetical protein
MGAITTQEGTKATKEDFSRKGCKEKIGFKIHSVRDDTLCHFDRREKSFIHVSVGVWARE